MNKKYDAIRLIISICFAFLPFVAHAKTVVFIHGYMAEGSIWQYSGVINRMRDNGWLFAGRYGFNQSYQVVQDVTKRPGDATVTVELPWQASIASQAELLNRYLQAIYKNRPEPMVLVGHSAGGVVARYGLIKHGVGNVESLITIATPHLGTPMAELAILASDSPLGVFMQDLGDPTLLASRDLFRDLVPARSGSFLSWLNQQKHPDIRYHSIIRTAVPVDLRRYDHADLVVPADYQDMNNVPMLKGKSINVASDGGHALVAKDADRVLQLLKRYR
ncbi:MAG: lipase family alpha/beta hydrolase [Leucothrix sp.]